MSLQENILKLKAGIQNQVPEETLRILGEETQRLKDSSITQNCLKVGDKAAAFSLPNSRGITIASQSFLEKGPLVVCFYRGGW